VYERYAYFAKRGVIVEQELIDISSEWKRIGERQMIKPVWLFCLLASKTCWLFNLNSLPEIIASPFMSVSILTKKLLYPREINCSLNESSGALRSFLQINRGS